MLFSIVCLLFSAVLTVQSSITRHHRKASLAQSGVLGRPTSRYRGVKLCLTFCIDYRRDLPVDIQKEGLKVSLLAAREPRSASCSDRE